MIFNFLENFATFFSIKFFWGGGEHCQENSGRGQAPLCPAPKYAPLVGTQYFVCRCAYEKDGESYCFQAPCIYKPWNEYKPLVYVTLTPYNLHYTHFLTLIVAYSSRVANPSGNYPDPDPNSNRKRHPRKTGSGFTLSQYIGIKIFEKVNIWYLLIQIHFYQ